MVRNADKNLKSGFIWNFIGSTVYAVVNVILGTVVIRVLGGDLGGIFSFAFATIGQHIYIISAFSSRPLHITDVTDKWSFADFRNFRLLTGLFALTAAIIFAVIYSGFSFKTSIIILMCLYKIIDTVSDVYESEFQRRGRLDLTGKILLIRTVACALVFSLTIIKTKSLLTACIALIITISLLLLFLCIIPINKFEGVSFVAHKNSSKELFDETKLLCLIAFIDMYVFAASKYAVDAKLSSTLSGYYNTIFFPSQVVLLLASFFLRPFLPKLSQMHTEGDYKSLTDSVRIYNLFVIGVTIFGMIFAWFLGIPCLSILVGSKIGAELMSYRFALVIIIAGGGVYAHLSIYYYLLIILKKQKAMFIVYLLGIIPAFALSFLFVDILGLTGAALALLISMLFIDAGLIISVKKYLTH